MTIKDPAAVTLFVVALNPFMPTSDGTPLSPSVSVREYEYTRAKNTLTAIETNEGRTAPYGLRRVRMAELPKVGGFTGLVVAALTKKEAVELLLKVARKEHDRAAERASALNRGIVELVSLKEQA